MDTADFLTLWDNVELRQFVIDQARRHTRNKEQQEDYVQEAWLTISCAPAGYCLEKYQDLAYKTIYSWYWQMYRERLMFRQAIIYGMPDGDNGDTTGYSIRDSNRSANGEHNGRGGAAY